MSHAYPLLPPPLPLPDPPSRCAGAGCVARGADGGDSMSFLFESNWARALELVDGGHVKRIVAQDSGRELFQVGSASGSRAGGRLPRSHLVFPEHFCTCHAFFYDVVSRGEAVLCKHQIAAQVASALGTCVTVVVPDSLVAQILSADPEV